MGAPFHPRAKESFLDAVELDAAERGRLLERLEREDPELAREVRELLSAHAEADAALVPHAWTAAARAPWMAGRRIGDYELLEEVGTGAFGVVWRARQVSLDRIVAVKVLRAGPFAESGDPERLRAEAAAVARLDHPGIVPVLEVGESAGHAFFSMKWVEGGTLAERLEPPWTPRRAALTLVAVARAVHHAHQRGLLHRDLKPSNVLLDAEGRPHVADFGIAERLDGAQRGTTHAFAGTPAYMAPEQAEGGELTVTTDVWALGCILYELLAGRPAFAGDSVTETLRRVREEQPPRLRGLRSDVPRDLETIVLAALRKETERRYPSADALAEDLERWLAHEPIGARRTGALGRLALFCRRAPFTATLLGVAAGLVLLLAIVATWASVALGARLRDAYVGEARATRLAGGVGARTAALALLQRAAAIHPGPDLRDEAIACLALPELLPERVLERPAGPEGPLAVDPVLERIVVSDQLGLRVVSLVDGSELQRLAPPLDAGPIVWSPGGRWVLAELHGVTESGRSTSLVVWDAASGAERIRRELRLSSRAVEFAPDDRRLAWADVGGELVVAGLFYGDDELHLEVGEGVMALRFAPDGARIALAFSSDVDRIEVRDARTGALQREVRLDAAPFDVRWTDGGRALAVASADGRVLVLGPDADEPELVCRGHAAEVTDVFASDGALLLASNSWDETTRLWDATTGEELLRLSGLALGFDAAGDRLAVAEESAWRVWRVVKGDYLRTVRAHTGKSPRALAFAPGGGSLATAGPDGVWLWDGRPGGRPAELTPLSARDVVFLPGGRTLAVCGPGGLLRVELDAADGPRQLLAEPLWRLALSADGHTLAALGARDVHLLDPDTGAELRTLPGAAGIEFLSISADGSRVAAGNWRGHGVRVWDALSADEPRAFDPASVNEAAALSPDGILLATTTSERFELRRVDDGTVLLRAERRRSFGNAPAPVAFSRDGTRVAFGLSSGLVRIVDVRTLATLANLEAPGSQALFDLSFSPDGALLGTAWGTNRVQVWDLAHLGTELAVLGLADGS